MRILHLIDTLEFGGAEKVLVALANASAARHEVSVCCLRRSGVLAKELDSRIEVFSMDKGSGDDPGLPLRLGRRIRGQFDVLHTHNWATFIEGGLAAMVGGVPMRVHTVHGPYSAAASGTAQRIKRGVRHAIERAVATRFQHIVAVSDAIRHYIPETIGIPARRLSTIHNGIVGLPASTPAQRAPAPLTFIAVGRLDPIKNHRMMLNAFAELARQQPAAVLRIVGDGPCRAALQAQAAELGLQQRVLFDGFRDDIPAVLAQADVFLMSSHYEGISIALLEAMRAGLPAVATRVGGIPETVLDQQSGLLVADDDAAGFAQAMRTLAADAALRHRLGAAALAYQQAEFSLDRMVQSYEALYQSRR